MCPTRARESPTGSIFERKGGPDAGVECYAVLWDGNEWGWQAKYFDVLGDSQWGQIDSSIRTALQKHPQLVRYFVCVPLDRPDARIGGRRSARERWDEHVQKWESWATPRFEALEHLIPLLRIPPFGILESVRFLADVLDPRGDHVTTGEQTRGLFAAGLSIWPKAL